MYRHPRYNPYELNLSPGRYRIRLEELAGGDGESQEFEIELRSGDELKRIVDFAS